jgi:hypothetical protein
MSRVFLDDNLLSWEAYASGGEFGLAERPKIIFHCLSHPGRPRFVVHDGDNADAEQAVHALDEQELRELLERSEELG